MVDIEVDIVDGSSNEVDSNDLAFQIAGSLAFKDAAGRAKPVLLEPIMEVECAMPSDYQGDVIGDLNRRRGQVREVVTRGVGVTVTADVPLAEMFGYANAIRSMSKGRATYSMTPSRFEIIQAAEERQTDWRPIRQSERFISGLNRDPSVYIESDARGQGIALMAGRLIDRYRGPL